MNFQVELDVGEYIDENLQIIRKEGGIGKSGFGVIYYVFNSENNNLVALKSLQPQFVRDKDKIYDFKQEGLITSKLKHPNILKSMGIWELNNVLYLIQEPIIPINGKINVGDYFEELNEEKVLNWAIQFCCGMEYAINEGITAHRDIKPSNILVSFDTIKISDFGLTDFYEKIHESNNFEYGTYEYLAPESFDRIFNEQTDIYSFGITLFQMINDGEFPFDFESNSRDEWERLHKTFILKPFDSILFPIVRKCLNKNPKDRYLSFNELKKDLSEIYKKYFNKSYIPSNQNIQAMDYIGMGQSYLINNNLSEAKKCFKKAIQLDSMSIDTYLYCGIVLIDTNNPFDALDYLKNCEKLLDDGNFDCKYEAIVYFNIGNAYHSINYKKAIEYYEKCIKNDESYLKAYVNSGNIYLDLGEYGKALKYYNLVLNKVPYFYEALVNKAKVLFKLKRYDESTRYFEKALKMNIKQDVVYSEWGHCFRDEGDESKAQEKFSKAINIKPLSLEHNYDLFISYLILNKLSLAKNKYYRIAELTNDMGIHLGLIKEFNNYGFNDEAIKLLDGIIENADNLFKSEAFCLKSNLSDSFEDKMYYLNESIQYNPNNISTLLKQGQLYKEQGLNDESMEIYEKILNIDSNNREALAEYGILLLINENYDLAREYLEKANKLDSPNPYIHFCLILLNVITENQKDLMKYLSEFKELGFMEDFPEFGEIINVLLGCE